MSKEKMKRTTIYLPESLHTSLKNVNKSEIIRKNLEQWAKKNSKLLNALALFLILITIVSPVYAENITMGDNIISNTTFIPFTWWIIAFIIGFLTMIVGFLLANFILELVATLFLWLSAYAAPMVGYFTTETVLTNSTNMTYTTISTVTLALQPFVSYLCYGIGAISFLLFTILIFHWIFEAMQEKSKKAFNNSEVDEFGGWL
jgi:hypothetical protein